MIEYGVLDVLDNLLNENSIDIRKLILLSISNIVCGPSDIIKSLIQKGIFNKILFFVENFFKNQTYSPEDLNILKECTYILCNTIVESMDFVKSYFLDQVEVNIILLLMYSLEFFINTNDHQTVYNVSEIIYTFLLFDESKCYNPSIKSVFLKYHLDQMLETKLLSHKNNAIKVLFEKIHEVLIEITPEN